MQLYTVNPALAGASGQALLRRQGQDDEEYEARNHDIAWLPVIRHVRSVLITFSNPCFQWVMVLTFR